VSRWRLSLGAAAISLGLTLHFYLAHQLEKRLLAETASFGAQLAFQNSRLAWFPPRLILEAVTVSFGPATPGLALETLSFSPALGEIRPASLTAVTSIADFSEDQNRVAVKISAALWPERNHAALRLSPVTVTLANLALNGDIQLRKHSGHLEYDGELNAPPFDPRPTLAALGLNAEVVDPDALRSASLKTRLKGTLSSLRLDQLTAKLDQTSMTGNIVVRWSHPPVTRMNLQLDSIDMNRYQPLQTFPENVDDYQPKESIFMLAAALVNALNARGRLLAGSLKLTDAQYTDQPFAIGAP